MHRPLTTAAGAALAAVLLAGCASGSDETSGGDLSPTTPRTTASTEEQAGSSPSTPTESDTADADDGWGESEDFRAEWDEGRGSSDAYEEVLDLGYSPDDEGLIDLPGAADWVFAPNGELWDVDMFYDLEVLLETGDPGPPSDGPASFSCAERWEDIDFLMLRGGPEYPHLYGVGAAAGPTCFEAPGGAVSDPGLREAHYLCQTANTSARALVSPVDDGPVVWTPQHTSPDERQCFGFGGAEIAVHEVDVSAAAPSDGDAGGGVGNPEAGPPEVEFTLDHAADGRHGLEVSVSFNVHRQAINNEANVIRAVSHAADAYPDYDLIIVRGYSDAEMTDGDTQLIDAWYTPENVENMDLENPDGESAYEHCYSCSVIGQHQ